MTEEGRWLEQGEHYEECPTKPGRQFPGVGTGAIVTTGNNLLMIKRAGAHGADTWSVPGGWVDKWEDPLYSATREVREETGIEVLPVRIIGYTNDLFMDDGIHAVTLWVLCKDPKGIPTVQEPDKCPEVCWVPFSDVDKRPLFNGMSKFWPSLWDGKVFSAVR